MLANYSMNPTAVIRVYDEAGNVIETLTVETAARFYFVT
jgi:hypothetical protein